MSKEKEYEFVYQNTHEQILDLEDMIDRMNTLNVVAYDRKFHQRIIKQYNAIIKDITSNAVLEEDDKKVFIEIIKTLFETINITIDVK